MSISEIRQLVKQGDSEVAREVVIHFLSSAINGDSVKDETYDLIDRFGNGWDMSELVESVAAISTTGKDATLHLTTARVVALGEVRRTAQQMDNNPKAWEIVYKAVKAAYTVSPALLAGIEDAVLSAIPEGHKTISYADAAGAIKALIPSASKSADEVTETFFKGLPSRTRGIEEFISDMPEGFVPSDKDLSKAVKLLAAATALVEALNK